jgi:iron complex outermembrane receptor protein
MMNRHGYGALALGLLTATCLITPQQARAADTAAASQTTVFDTLVVTARKRAELAQTVPISISAFDQAAVERLNIEQIGDLRFVAPSVYTAMSTFRQDTLNVTIRGQRNFDSTGLQFDTATAVYVDGVYYARPVGLTGALFDVDTVQVLKGPQGTLVGRNSTGGAILYDTKQPTSEFGGYVKATVGNFDRRGFEGAINIPFSEQFAVRAAISQNEVEGYIKNNYRDPATGAVNDTPGMGARQINGRLSIKWTPSDTFSLLLRGSKGADHFTGATYHALGYFEGTVLAAANRPSICNIPGTCIPFTDLFGRTVAPYYSDFTIRTINTAPGAYNSPLNSLVRQEAAGFWSTEQAFTSYNTGHSTVLSAVADKSISTIDIKLTGAFREMDTKGISSSRGLPYVTNVFTYGMPNYKSYQSELTVNGVGFSDRLNWTTGLFFFRETSPNDGDQLYLFLPNGMTAAAVAGRQITYTDPTGNGGRNTSYAAYAQGTFDLGARTRLTAGVRYTRDVREAHLETKTVRTPATAATTATVRNGVFDPGPYTIYGITYSGTTRACALTDTAGVLLPLSQCSVDLNRTFKKPTWTLSLDHDLTDTTMIYATARKGYRAGAINSAAINPAVLVAKPEDVTDYELGVKADWTLGGIPVRTNLAAYWTDYRNIQIQTTLPNVTVASAPGGAACTQAVFDSGQCVGFTNDNVTLNARKARIRGAEWEVQVRPVPSLNLGVTGSYIDAFYTDYTFTPPGGYLLPTSRTNLSGTPIPLPQWQLTGTAAWTVDGANLGGGFDSMVLSGRAFWQSRFEADRRPYHPSQITSPYALVNLRLDINSIAGRNVDFALFANNVFKKEACLPETAGVLSSTPQGTFGQPGTSGLLQCVPLAPRMYGASLKYSF